MPELPEVETVVRTLLPHIRQAVFDSVYLLRPSTLHPLSLPLESLSGLAINNVYRRAKLIVMDIGRESGSEGIPSFLILHLRMTGRIFTTEANREQGKHTRCIFDLKMPDLSKFRLFFDDARTFGQIIAATPAILKKWSFWRELGPEPLTLDTDTFISRLQGRRPIKICLMDQKVIAGVGNIYADEALFQAGISPMRQASSLSPEEAATMLQSIKNILNLSISQCGSSIRDYRDANGNAGAFQNSFLVYGRGGKKCKKCGNILQKTRLGGRSTVFCEHCQQ